MGQWGQAEGHSLAIQGAVTDSWTGAGGMRTNPCQTGWDGSGRGDGSGHAFSMENKTEPLAWPEG